jgi:hypothetical protein
MKTVICGLFMVCILFTGADALEDWTQKYPASKPSARHFHAMAYMGGDQVLLFGGGVATASETDETWIYDLSENAWIQKGPPSKPPKRIRHAMAYMGGDQVLLFGGSGWDVHEDTWIYDLRESTWIQQNPQSKPSWRYRHAMAYIGKDQVLLFGGDRTKDFCDDTWVYTLSESTWTQKSPSAAPSARHGHDMAYIGGDQVLLFGGYDAGDYNDETWVYDLSENTWTQQNPSVKPSARRDHVTAYLGGDRVLLFGGWDALGYSDETWVYDLSDENWTQDTNTTQPSPRKELGLSETSMDGSSLLVLFGGWDTPDFNDETWTFGGGDYPVSVEPTSLPSDLPRVCRLSQNCPNPFNASTEIRYQIPKDGHVTLKIFNTLGQEVRTLVDGQERAGEYEVSWDGRAASGHEVASGLYFCRLKAGEFGKTVKMLLLR